MIIGLVCDDSLDKTDGVQQYVLTLGAWLTKKGHTVHYVTSTTDNPSLKHLHTISRNIGVRFNGNRLRVPLPASRRTVKQLLRAGHFDVLHVQMPYSPVLAGRVVSLAGNSTAVIGTFHIFPYSRLVEVGAAFLARIVGRSLRRFDHIMSVSTAAQQFAADAFRVDSSVVPNLVDVTRFSKAVPQKTHGTVVISFLGRLVERKGAMHLLEAIAYLHENRLTKTRFIVRIGGKGHLLEDLRAYVANAELSDIVQFVGFVSETDKPGFLASSDIIALPSTGGESFGISVVEALAASRGVVLAGDNAGYRSVMQSFESQLIDPQDTVRFAQQLAYYIDNPQARTVARLRQRKHAQQFDLDVVGNQVLAVYVEALRSRN